MTYFVEVEEKVSIGCRFYPARKDATTKNALTILYFHGNGETACDYDGVAPMYNEKYINLFVTDYRGYGFSDGYPTASTLIRDAHRLFGGCRALLNELHYNGRLFVMGRSLGSAPAIEVAYHYQNHLDGLIIESGFASTRNLLHRLGCSFDRRDFQGFCNRVKIENICLPTFLIHAENDRVIPVSEALELYNRSRSPDKVLMVIPDADHHDLMMVGEERYFGGIERFVAKAITRKRPQGEKRIKKFIRQ
ncbi:MAG: alpha/beta hydrolase [Deltaproteobacteria bacterium]|nr:alpha/beta hydrolase [Deltaproteobacteria bacterium]